MTAEVSVVPEGSAAKAAIWAYRLGAARLGTTKVVVVVDVPEHRGTLCIAHGAWGKERLTLHQDRVSLVELS